MRLGRIVAWVCALLLFAGSADARPGGGGSFSRPSGGGSRSGSSSGSGGGSRSSSGSGGSSSKPSKPRWLVRGTEARDRAEARQTWVPGAVSPYGPPAERPDIWPARNEISGTTVWAFLFALASVFVGGCGAILYGIRRVLRRKLGQGWSTAALGHLQSPGVTPLRSRNELEVMRSTDPDFSVALFEDFLYAIFTEAHIARGAGTLERLSPYLAPAVRQGLAARARFPVRTVVLGAMRFGSHARVAERDRVVVEYEANFAEVPPQGPEQAFWVAERWTLSRATTARSRPPERVRILDCPGCGATLDKILGGVCSYCQRNVDGGDFDWQVETIQLVSSEQRGPMLTGTTVEQGTDLPTVIDPALDVRLAALKTKDPAFDDNAFLARVGLVFTTMQHAWTSLEWHRARPFLSDNLYHTQTYWIDAYRRSGLRNVTERARILRVDLARMGEDKWLDSITVRVFATGLDYTLRDYDGAVVGGDRSRERTYSEYWTLIRSSTATGRARTEPVCPQCGAALEVNMAGDCKYCKATLHSGKFDWVLARIEQDEVYAG